MATIEELERRVIVLEQQLKNRDLVIRRLRVTEDLGTEKIMAAQKAYDSLHDYFGEDP